jgi:hypothetical protein
MSEKDILEIKVDLGERERREKEREREREREDLISTFSFVAVCYVY